METIKYKVGINETHTEITQKKSIKLKVDYFEFIFKIQIFQKIDQKQKERKTQINPKSSREMQRN